MVFLNKLNSDVATIRSFLDETYQSPILNSRARGINHSAQMPWARIGVEKFCDRIIPHFSGNNPNVENAISAIMGAIKNAICFGNGTVIVDGNGKARSSIPESSYSELSIFGEITYVEEHVNKLNKNDSKKAVGVNGILYLIDDDDDETLIETSSRYFSIFYKADGYAPQGRSRISPSIRNSIREASRNKIRAMEAANFRTFPQWIINGVWEDLDPSVVNNVGSLAAGISSVIGIPENPETGQKVSIEEFTSSDFNSYISQQELLAKEVAAAFNLDASELGVAGSQPTSAETLYATKEDLVLEISAFERVITQTVQNICNDISEKTNTEKVVLSWQEPATPSKAAQADAFVKLASILPQLQFSKKALAWAGLPADLIEDITVDEEYIRDHSLNINEIPYSDDEINQEELEE